MSQTFSQETADKLFFLKQAFELCDDIVFQDVYFNNVRGCIIYLSEMIDSQAIIDIEHGLSAYPIDHLNTDKNEFLTSFVKNRFPFSMLIQANQVKPIEENVLSGYTILIIDGVENVFTFNTKKAMGRSIEEPNTEQAVRGPREGFVEDIETNLMMIRRKLRTSSLKVEYVTLGTQTQTKVAIVYLKGVANREVVVEVQERLSRIQTDGILESRYIESHIQDAPLSPFPTLYSTERPDRVSAALLEGKVVVLTDGTPFALTAPAVLVEFLHSNEDYYSGSLPATVIRWIRTLGLLVALILPAFLVAITTFHQDLLQTPFLIRIAGQREDLPYPVVVEAFFMLLTFELIREAGLRMPRPFGNGITTILGLLLIGQATIQAGLVGSLTLIVISVTALTTFILPNYSFQQAIRYLSLPMLILAGMFGFMGLLVGLLFVLTHLVSIRSFGVPYLSPVSPAVKGRWKDVFMRAPWWAMDRHNEEDRNG
jgi:hypothetical protein